MFRLGPKYITPSLRPKTVADLTVLSLFLIMGTVFWFSDGLQIWMVRSLGFGWIPALIFLLSVNNIENSLLILKALTFESLLNLFSWVLFRKRNTIYTQYNIIAFK